MNREAVMRAAYFACLALDNRPTRRAVLAMIALITKGRSFRSSEVGFWLASQKREPNGTKPGTTIRPNREPRSPRKNANWDQTGNHGEASTGTTHARVAKVNSQKSLFSPSGEVASAPSAPPPAPKPKRERKKPDKPDPAVWYEPVRQRLQAERDAQLCDLEPDQRFDLAMLHAWRWCNCRADEGKNRQMALKVAQGLSDLCAHEEFGEWTVAEYVGAAEQAWTLAGKRPMHSPWAIKASLTGVG